MEAISQFRHLTKANEKEKVLQKHLFGHLFLLDPAWERAAVGGRMEEDLREIAPGLFARGRDGREVRGRFDIRYATAGGSHVIVELKRYSVRVGIEDLVEQGMKYFAALRSILRQQNRTQEPIEVIFVLGQHPRVREPGAMTEAEYIGGQLAPLKGRYVLYDELIENAKRQYEEYLAASDKARELDALLESLDATAGEAGSNS